MAKIKLGNVKGPKGDQGVRGSKWYNTDKITGESTSGTAFPDSGIADAMVGDMALNPTTLNLYTCQTAGDAATAKWVFMACIKGPQGVKGDKGDPTTVDAALSATSTNPIQNKAVATKFKDVQDSLDRLILKKTMTLTTSPNGNGSVELSSDDYTLIAVKCATAVNNHGVICIPYIFSLGSRLLGFHTMSEVSPFPTVANKELTVDVYYMRRFQIASSGKIRLTFSYTDNHAGGFIYCTGNGTLWYGMVGKTSKIVGSATVTHESGGTFLVEASAWNYGVIIPIGGTVDVKPA